MANSVGRREPRTAIDCIAAFCSLLDCLECTTCSDTSAGLGGATLISLAGNVASRPAVEVLACASAHALVCASTGDCGRREGPFTWLHEGGGGERWAKQLANFGS